MPIPTRSLAVLACLAAFGGLRAAERDLVLVDWEEQRWTLRPDITLERDVGKAPNGEPLARLTLHSPGDGQYVYTAATLPVTARTLSMFIKATAKGSGVHVALFQDAGGWGGTGNTLWGVTQDSTYQTNALDHGWSWRTGFFHAKVAAPFRFVGWHLHGRDPAKPGETFTPSVLECGPVHVSYEPSDAEWLWCDLQPKTVPTMLATGEQPALTLRVGNLGETVRTFALSAVAVERAGRPLDAKPVALGTLTLQPGEVKAVPAKLPLALLGRYEIEYRATLTGTKEPSTRREAIAVVNAEEQAAGLRAYVAKRRWFTSSERRATVVDGKPAPTLGKADNGLAAVPLYPLLPSGVHPFAPVDAAITLQRGPDKEGKARSPYGEHVLASQFSPAWLVTTDQPSLALFDELREHGEGAPTHLAFMTSKGARVIAAGDAVAAADLATMSEPWLLAWFAGAAGWSRFDAPVLVALQRRPTALTFDAHGLSLTFGGPAGSTAVMTLYGYAKLPQRAWSEQHADDVRLPADWPTADLRPWTWTSALPASVAARCTWWSRALLRFPTQVKESYVVDHAAGSVKVHDEFGYLELENDWKTPALAVAPLSPTLALARRGGFPSTVSGKLVDCTCATMLGPYQVVEGRAIDWTMDIGPYVFQSADLDPSTADAPAAVRAAVESLAGPAFAAENDPEAHMWAFRDGNFVWWAQREYRWPLLSAPMLPPSLRTDLKSWSQAMTLGTVLDQSRYGQDERCGLFRRYIDGPGIGNFGSGDWGDSGKLGQDMLYDLYAYAYGTGDWQTVADHWDTVASLVSMPTSMTWCAIGRTAIAEEGDEAPTMLALARLAYAVGDKPLYGAAVYWFGRELVHHAIKEGAFKAWQAELTPWNPDWDAHTNPSNLWGTNACWVGHGPFAGHDVGEWVNRVTRFDDLDTLRFLRDHATGLAKEEVAFDDAHADQKRDDATAMVLYLERVAFLGLDPAAATERHVASCGKGAPDSWLARRAAIWREAPPRLATVIPASESAIADDAGWAWQQMGNCGYGLVQPVSLAPGHLPTPQWFWWTSPRRAAGEWGEKWSFGSIAPRRDQVVEAVDAQDVGWGAQVFHVATRRLTPIDRLVGPMREIAAKAGLSDAELQPIVEAWEQQQSIPVLVCGPFTNPGGGPKIDIVHAPEAAWLEGKLDAKQRFHDTGADGKRAGAPEIGWRAASLEDTALDFNRWWADRHEVAAYVAFAVRSPADRAAEFAMGSDDGIAVCLNGQLVHRNGTTRGTGMDQDHATVALKSGWNRVLVKVTQGDGGWALNFRVADDRGLPIPGLTFAAEPPR